MTADEVVAEISRRAWRFGVSVLLSPDATVETNGFQSGGYFCGDSKTLAVAAGSQDQDKWLGTLLHEYCHLTQWIEGQPAWLAYRSDMWDWLGGKRIRDPEDAVSTVQALEADCERRTLRLARELGAPLDLEKYARAANAYLHFHNTIRETRKWYRNGMGPYLRPDVLALCNPTIDKDFSKTPAKLRKALLTCV